MYSGCWPHNAGVGADYSLNLWLLYHDLGGLSREFPGFSVHME